MAQQGGTKLRSELQSLLAWQRRIDGRLARLHEGQCALSTSLSAVHKDMGKLQYDPSLTGCSRPSSRLVIPVGSGHAETLDVGNPSSAGLSCRPRVASSTSRAPSAVVSGEQVSGRMCQRRRTTPCIISVDCEPQRHGWQSPCRTPRELAPAPPTPMASPHALPSGSKEAAMNRQSSKRISQLITSTNYKDSGWASQLVRSHYFEFLSLAVVTTNAIWIAIDTDHNKEDVLLNAAWYFQVAENFFCAYFVAEWIIRFVAFSTVLDAVRDVWFMFDSVLVAFMITETWIMTFVIWVTNFTNSGALGSTGILRMLRLLRLTRLSRIVRLLRSLPELLFMLKGVAAATRSVGCTLGMLFAAVYIFGIAFTQLSEGTTFKSKYFDTVPDSIYTLLLDGAFMDSTRTVMDAIRRESTICLVMFAVVILITHLTIMNMLIGVLCEVVSNVSSAEKEKMERAYVKDKVRQMLSAGGLEPWTTDRTISKDDFLKLVQSEQTMDLMEKIGVEPIVLVDFADLFFQSDSLGRRFDKRLVFDEFIDTIMKLRITNPAKLRDIAELRKSFRDESLDMKATLARIDERQRNIEAKLDGRATQRGEAPPAVSSRAAVKAL